MKCKKNYVRVFAFLSYAVQFTLTALGVAHNKLRICFSVFHHSLRFFHLNFYCIKKYFSKYLRTNYFKVQRLKNLLINYFSANVTHHWHNKLKVFQLVSAVFDSDLRLSVQINSDCRLYEILYVRSLF